MRDLAPISPVPRAGGQGWRIFGTLLSLALLVFLVWTQGWQEFLQALRTMPFIVFLGGLGVILLSRLAVTLRWYVLLRSAGVPMPFLQSLRLVFMGLFASNFLPSTVGGDLVRLAGAVYLRLDAGVVAASLLVDRLIGMAGMASFLPVGLAAILPAAVGSAPPAAVLAPLPWLRRMWQKGLQFGRKLLVTSMFWIKHPSSLVWAFLCTFVHMAMTFLACSFLLAGMGEPVSFWVIGGLWSFSYFISLAPFSINGLGLQEVSIAYLYSQFGGTSMHTGLALAVLLRMVFLLASLPGALFLPDILRPLPRGLSGPAGHVQP